MKPVNVFPSVETILHCSAWLRKSLVVYCRFLMLQVIRPSNPTRNRGAETAQLARAIVITGYLLMITAVPLPAQTAKAVADIQSVLHAQQEAWNRGDIDGFMDGYARSASTVFISGDEVRRGWETVRERYRQKYSDRTKMGALTFSEIEITLLSPDAVAVIGRWRLKRANDEPHGRFTLIFKLLPEGWRIVQDHTSAASP
jgi:uncharacterized protein (TIGR02246 family)